LTAVVGFLLLVYSFTSEVLLPGRKEINLFPMLGNVSDSRMLRRKFQLSPLHCITAPVLLARRNK